MSGSLDDEIGMYARGQALFEPFFFLGSGFPNFSRRPGRHSVQNNQNLLRFFSKNYPLKKSSQSSIIKKIRRKGASKMKKFFRIEESYKFEWNDLRALITFINVILIMIFGLSIAWFGLIIALIGLIKDFTTDRRINGILMHFSSVVLNVYFLTFLLTK